TPGSPVARHRSPGYRGLQIRDRAESRWLRGECLWHTDRGKGDSMPRRLSPKPWLVHVRVCTYLSTPAPIYYLLSFHCPCLQPESVPSPYYFDDRYDRRRRLVL